jgi:hypothetical protein
MDKTLPITLIHNSYYGPRCLPLGGDILVLAAIFIARYWQPPCSAGDVATWVAVLAAWVAMRSQECCRGMPLSGSEMAANTEAASA